MTGLSSAPRYRSSLQPRSQQSTVRASSDTIAPRRSATRPGARQRPARCKNRRRAIVTAFHPTRQSDHHQGTRQFRTTEDAGMSAPGTARNRGEGRSFAAIREGSDVGHPSPVRRITGAGSRSSAWLRAIHAFARRARSSSRLAPDDAGREHIVLVWLIDGFRRATLRRAGERHRTRASPHPSSLRGTAAAEARDIVAATSGGSLVATTSS